MATVADNVVRFIVSIGDIYDDGDSINNMKLQKLLYYFQGFHLAAFGGKDLFYEDVEAWEHGPVVPPVWREFTHFGRQPIILEKSYEEEKPFREEQLELMNNVYRVYGQYSAWKLREMTHKEMPWMSAREKGKKTKDYVITKESMAGFFKNRLR